MFPSSSLYFAIVVHLITYVISYPSHLDSLSNLERRDDPTDPEDFSAVTGFAGLGDSFPAGIGTGSPYDDDAYCARGDTGYPNLMNQDARLGDPEGRTFQFLACSGATTKDILERQLPKTGGNQQLITLSAGGNDVGLSKILDACIFQWSPVPADCEATIADSQKVIDEELSDSLNNLYTETKKRLGTDPKIPGRIYVTGYGKYFNPDTPQCDKQTWSFWYQRLNAPYLTQDLRKRLNDMVDAVNGKISDAVKAAGEQVVFVDWDKYFVRFRGRYCEKNVAEPSASRLGLLFYEWETVDNGEPSPDDPKTELRRSGTAVGNGTFGGDINRFVQETVNANPDWTYAKPGGPTDQTTIMKPETDVDKSDSCQVGTNRGPLSHICMGDLKDQLGVVQSYLPTTWLRVFHPRPPGHAIIANLVLWYMHVERTKVLNQQPGPEISTVTACGHDPVPSPVSDVTASSAAVSSSIGLICSSPSTMACATFNVKRDVAPVTVTAAPLLSRRQGPGVVPFGPNPPPATLPSDVNTGPATTCSCTV
ncbi:hypothetical protein ACLMJK_002901 [Lecanora helva]